ncbi:hypothetical protein B0J11DRAFT_34985 [Dendryphion nanum]|uniref:Uncharacterized protein n=1 Tax=Dendryphion nanum TaxID=256645 RepID=A0A9P9IX99_9PLEO|nr:hypothetical protein B0J11DRAFT_34985 [Dendryphion nanum]
MVEARSSLPTYRSPVPISGLNSIPPTPPVIINTAVPGSRNSYSYLSPPPPPPEPRTSDSIMGEVPISRIAVVPIQDPQITSNALQSDYPPPPEYPGRTGPSDEYTWVRSSNRTRDKSRSVHASRERDPYAAAYEYTDSYRPRHRTESYDRSAERRMRETLGARHSVRPGVTIYRNERGERDREGERNVERDRMRDAYSYSPQVYDYRERSRGSRY